MGFTFDDTDTESVASSLTEIKRLIEKDPRNQERIFPYIGGEEFNQSPTHAHHRYVINFEDFSLELASEWPDLLALVDERVKPVREMNNRENYKKFWWQFAERRPGLEAAARNLTHVFAHPFTSTHLAFCRVPRKVVIASPHIAFVSESLPFFAAVQSRPHEVWARFMASSMKDDLRYTPSDCFETFAFPDDYESNTCLEEIGRTYYNYRAELMIRNNEGLTKTYNRFHSPNERSADIKKLRELHDQMDRAVLHGYGWSDIRPVCEFFPEFEDDEEDESESRRPRTKKYRYRWPDEIHDEVLARLLALNQERAAQGR
jgi:hypothetical protein